MNSAIRILDFRHRAQALQCEGSHWRHVLALDHLDSTVGVHYQTPSPQLVGSCSKKLVAWQDLGQFSNHHTLIPSYIGEKGQKNKIEK